MRVVAVVAAIVVAGLAAAAVAVYSSADTSTVELFRGMMGQFTVVE